MSDKKKTRIKLVLVK